MRLIERLKQILSWKIKLDFYHILNSNQVGFDPQSLPKMLQDPRAYEYKNNRIPSLSFHVSLSSSFSFTSTTLLHRQCCSQNSLNSWLLQTMPGLPGSRLDVEFEALCAKIKLPLLFFIIPHTNVKAKFRGRSNQGHVHNAKKTFWSPSESGFEL